MEIRRDGELLWLRIASRNNTIGTRLMADLREALNEHAADDSLRVALLRGDGAKFFCPGLDLLEVARLARPEMGRFMANFSRLCIDLFSHPKPVLAVLDGHALAGGFLLAGCCDFRVGRLDATVGLTPLNRAVPVPFPALLMLESRFGRAKLSEALFPGVNHGMEEARRLGWVDRTAAPEALEGEAERWARELATQSPATFWAMKRHLVEPVVKRVQAAQAVFAEEFLDRWFSEESRDLIGQLVQRLKGD